MRVDAGAGLGLRRRLWLAALWLVLGSGLLCCVAGYLWVASQTRQRIQAGVDTAGRDAAKRLEVAGAGLVDRLDAVAVDLVRRQPALLERLLDGRADPGDPLLLDSWGKLTGLDWLELLDDDGVVMLSSYGAAPPTKRPQLGEWSAGRALWTMIEPRPVGGPAILHAARTRAEIGELTVWVAGGRRASRVVTDLVVGGGTRVWLESTARGTRSDSALIRDGGEESWSGEDGAAWRSSSVRLIDPGGADLGRIVVARSLEPYRIERAQARAVFAGLFFLVAIAGGIVGAQLLERAARPVERTVEAVEAIMAGEADYSFTDAGSDRLTELPERFSRMYRALDDQRRRRAAAERVAAWREVARRVAHEVKNPLVPIRLTMQNLLKARRQAPEMFDEVLEDGSRAILEEVQQLERLVNEFSEFARLPEPQLRRENLDSIVDDVLALYAERPEIRLDRRRDDKPLAIEADADLLSRAIKNVVHNAVEAMSGTGGGELIVETGADDRSAWLRVADSGPGFGAGEVERIFEPYFTTKEHGTGLGLALAYRILADHGGFITACNRPTGGAELVLKVSRTAEDR